MTEQSRYVWKVDYDIHVEPVRPAEGGPEDGIGGHRPGSHWSYLHDKHVVSGPYMADLMKTMDAVADTGTTWVDQEYGWVMTRSEYRVCKAERLMRLDHV